MNNREPRDMVCVYYMHIHVVICCFMVNTSVVSLHKVRLESTQQGLHSLLILPSLAVPLARYVVNRNSGNLVNPFMYIFIKGHYDNYCKQTVSCNI